MKQRKKSALVLFCLIFSCTWDFEILHKENVYTSWMQEITLQEIWVQAQWLRALWMSKTWKNIFEVDELLWNANWIFYLTLSSKNLKTNIIPIIIIESSEKVFLILSSNIRIYLMFDSVRKINVISISFQSCIIRW